jgi:hypothetical protein
MRLPEDCPRHGPKHVAIINKISVNNNRITNHIQQDAHNKD